MPIAAKVKTVNRFPQLKKQAQAGNYNSLKQASFSLRLIAKRSIKRRKGPSAPGTPPHTHSRGRGLGKVIEVEIVTEAQTFTGPASPAGRTIWDLMEHGGRTRRRRQKNLKERRPKIGQVAPINEAGGKVQRARITTAAQAERAERITKQANEIRAAKAGEILNYPARPFMGPALEKAKPRIPQHWKNSIG